jgi:hypothetical protein
MRCVYCHGDWISGYTCECGATYHGDCVLRECVTLGCSVSPFMKSWAVPTKTVPIEPKLTWWQEKLQNFFLRFAPKNIQVKGDKPSYQFFSSPELNDLFRRI